MKYVQGHLEVQRAMAQIVNALPRVTKKGADAAANVLYKQVRANVSLVDHDLEDLANEDHPYAAIDPQSIHTPNWLVHAQSRKLFKAIQKQVTITPQGYQISVGVDENQAPHARFVILGTSKMIARDFLTGSFKQVQRQMTEIIAANAKKVLPKGVR